MVSIGRSTGLVVQDLGSSFLVEIANRVFGVRHIWLAALGCFLVPGTSKPPTGPCWMDLCYSSLKLSTLKDLLESRGQNSSNKSKATLIAKLMESDQASDQSRGPAMEGSRMGELQ